MIAMDDGSELRSLSSHEITDANSGNLFLREPKVLCYHFFPRFVREYIPLSPPQMEQPNMLDDIKLRVHEVHATIQQLRGHL